jgi:hypothetical protein
MDAKIRDFRSVERADLDLSGLCVIAGPNGAGKSSIARAVAAALTGQTVPFAGVGKGNADMLVRLGAAKASVALSHGDTGKPPTGIHVNWPSAERMTAGPALGASIYAAGLASVLIDHDDRKRASILAQYLKAAPEREDLATALIDAGISDNPLPPEKEGGPRPSHVERIWQSTQTEGWDAAHARAKETGIRLKGQWEGVTHEKYGSKKGASWQPEGWDSTLDGASEDTLTAEASQAREFLEAAIAEAAVGEHERKALEDKAATIPALSQKVHDLDLAYQRTKSALVEAENRVRALPPTTNASATQSCPHCNQPLLIVAGKITKPEARAFPDAADNEERKRMLDKATAAVTAAKGELQAAYDAYKSAERDLREAAAAVEKLKTLPAASTTPAAVEDCRRKVALADQRLAAFRAKREADRLFNSIRLNQVIIDALSPDGVRKTRLTRVLEAFNRDQLAPLCVAAGWQPVTLSPTLDVEYGGRPYSLLSTGQQWRCRVTLALAMARIDGSALAIFDVDVPVDRAGCNGLFAMALAAGLPTLICMTMSRPEEAAELGAKLAAKAAGRVYWLANGTAAPAAAEQRDAP